MNVLLGVEGFQDKSQSYVVASEGLFVCVFGPRFVHIVGLLLPHIGLCVQENVLHRPFQYVPRLLFTCEGSIHVIVAFKIRPIRCFLSHLFREIFVVLCFQMHVRIDFCHTKVMSSFGYLHTTPSFHSMQNWNRWLYLLQMNYGYFLDVYKWQSSFSLYSLTLHVQNHEAIDMGILILRYKLALFAFNFVILRVMCRPSYIWICYDYLIIYLFSEVSGDPRGRT